MSTDAAVEVSGLISRFGAQVVHDGVDLTVRQGEVMGIVGGSGTGKSVLLRSLFGLRISKAAWLSNARMVAASERSLAACTANQASTTNASVCQAL